MLLTTAQRKAHRRAYRTLRAMADLTAATVAKRVRLDEATYSKIENARRLPTEAERKAIAKALGVAVSALPTLQEAA